jgi:hypothetical protein
VNSPSRRRAVIYMIPMIIALVLARRLVQDIRLGDFVLVFAAGAVFGVTLLGLIQALRAPGPPVERSSQA